MIAFLVNSIFLILPMAGGHGTCCPIRIDCIRERDARVGRRDADFWFVDLCSQVTASSEVRKKSVPITEAINPTRHITNMISTRG